jgi:uncharacterized damage-inducible protein DinB
MSNFSLEKTFEILHQTPETLISLLRNLSSDWIHASEGNNTWSPFDVVGHLIHGEKTDWIPRLKIILFNDDKTFLPFDRFAQFEHSKGKTIDQLLLEFKTLRKENLKYLTSLGLSDSDFCKEGIHPEFGTVTIKQLLATWATHDLGHIAQISRVLAKHYKKEVGPWTAYISILNQ